MSMFSTTTEVIGSGVAVVTTVWGAKAFINKWAKERARQLLRDETLQQIADQFKPNSGHTLHDRLVTIEKKIDKIRSTCIAFNHRPPEDDTSI